MPDSQWAVNDGEREVGVGFRAPSLVDYGVSLDVYFVVTIGFFCLALLFFVLRLLFGFGLVLVGARFCVFFRQPIGDEQHANDEEDQFGQ